MSGQPEEHLRDELDRCLIIAAKVGESGCYPILVWPAAAGTSWTGRLPCEKVDVESQREQGEPCEPEHMSLPVPKHERRLKEKCSLDLLAFLALLTLLAFLLFFALLDILAFLPLLALLARLVSHRLPGFIGSPCSPVRFASPGSHGSLCSLGSFGFLDSPGSPGSHYSLGS